MMNYNIGKTLLISSLIIQKIHKKRNKILSINLTIVIKNLKIMNILVFFLELILTWMILIKIWYRHTKEIVLEIFKIWVRKSSFKNRFKIKLNVNKWMSLLSIMMMLIMISKKIKNKVYLINQILGIYLWDYLSAKDILSFKLIVHQGKMNLLKILMNLYLS